MGILMRFFVVNTLGIKHINADLARRVDDMSVAHADAYVDDTPLFVLEKGQVVALQVADADLHATGDLFRCVAWQPDIQGLETDLCKARTVDAAGGASAPEVGGVQEKPLGQVGSAVEGYELLVVNPPAIAVVGTLYKAPTLLMFNDFHGIAEQQLVDHLTAVAGFGPHGHGR